MEMDSVRFWSLLIVLLIAAYILSPPQRYVAVPNNETGAVWVVDTITGKARSCFTRCDP